MKQKHGVCGKQIILLWDIQEVCLIGGGVQNRPLRVFFPQNLAIPCNIAAIHIWILATICILSIVNYFTWKNLYYVVFIINFSFVDLDVSFWC